jgi:hypothetical protein
MNKLQILKAYVHGRVELVDISLLEETMQKAGAVILLISPASASCKGDAFNDDGYRE